MTLLLPPRQSEAQEVLANALSRQTEVAERLLCDPPWSAIAAALERQTAAVEQQTSAVCQLATAVDALSTELAGKAEQSELSSLASSIEDKAAASELAAVLVDMQALRDEVVELRLGDAVLGERDVGQGCAHQFLACIKIRPLFSLFATLFYADVHACLHCPPYIVPRLFKVLNATRSI